MVATKLPTHEPFQPQAATVQLPSGERVPFLFTMKKLVAKGSGGEFKPGFTWGGEFEVPPAAEVRARALKP